MFGGVHLWILFLPPPALAQEGKEEIFANLAAGRVWIYVASGGIVFATLEEPAERGGLPPLVVPLSEKRVAVILGAAEWIRPASGRPPICLDREFLRQAGQMRPERPSLESDQPSDLEQYGLAMLAALRAAAGLAHGKIEVAEDEPVLEVVIIGFAENYGPEAWLLKYRLVQDFLREDFYRTRISRPSYEQLYPPEKGQPRSVVEVRFPEDAGGASLPDLLRGNDPRLAAIRASSLPATRAMERLAKGEAHKTHTDEALAFVRAALGALAPQGAAISLGRIRDVRGMGLEWVIAPPERPALAEQPKPREPGAPSLRKPQP